MRGRPVREGKRDKFRDFAGPLRRRGQESPIKHEKRGKRRSVGGKVLDHLLEAEDLSGKFWWGGLSREDDAKNLILGGKGRKARVRRGAGISPKCRNTGVI